MISYWEKKFWQYDAYRFWIYFVLASASILRIFLIALGWPVTNSDEGTMGLMARHIAFQGEFPIFFYGQNYMGALEAYIAAPLFRLFDSSLFTLRFGLVALFALFLLILYHLISLLYTKKYALLSVTLLSFGSTEMLTRQLKAVGGGLETLLFGSFMLLLATYLALSSSQETNRKSYKSRFFLYWLLGCSIGIGIWSHMLVLPFVGVSFLLLFLFCRNDWRTRSTFFLLLGLLIGLFPLLLFNIEHPLQNSLGTLWQLSHSGGTAGGQSTSLLDNVVGTIVISVPEATGAPYLCSVSSSPGYWKEQLSSCIIMQSVWGTGFVFLWLLAGWLTVRKLWNVYRSVIRTRSLQEQRCLIIYTAQLMVLISAGLTLLAFMLSPAPALVPATAARYLIGLLVAVPSVLAVLWDPLYDVISAAKIHRIMIFKRAGFLLIGLLLLYSTVEVFQQIPTAQALLKQRQVFITDLVDIHATHIYSDYWTCDDVIFQSQERIICSVIDGDFQPGQDRYLPYRSIVQQDTQAAYVFRVGSPQAELFFPKMDKFKKRYSKLIIDGYVVYQYLK